EGPSKAAARHAEHEHEQHESADSSNLPGGGSGSGPTQLVGRTMCDRIVVFEGNKRQIGRLLPVSIYDANAHTLFGEVVTQHVVPQLYSLA
ncbi:MAG TPA: TRAM domain-containing protein, partial [Lacipirellulaceae bacterium]|nr:TRAM domain-containing protein [Lacipirellulaceae bacterium]